MNVSGYDTLFGYLSSSQHRASGASTRSTTNSCSPIIRVTSFTIHVESSQVALRNSGFCEISLDVRVEKTYYVIDYMRYGTDSRTFVIVTTDGHMLRYCIPMDNHRPELDLRFYKDICPDNNGASLRIFMTVSKASR